MLMRQKTGKNSDADRPSQKIIEKTDGEFGIATGTKGDKLS